MRKGSAASISRREAVSSRRRAIEILSMGAVRVRGRARSLGQYATARRETQGREGERKNAGGSYHAWTDGESLGMTDVVSGD